MSTKHQLFGVLVLFLIIKSATSCGQGLYARTGTIVSPSSVNETCEWRITAAPDERILLNVTHLEIEKRPQCLSGYIEVRDGYWYNSPLLGKFCGSGRLNPIISFGSTMLVSYVNNSTAHSGFRATYESICGGDLFVDRSTRLVSPNYPNQYPLSKKCYWRIIVPDGQNVVLNFQSFDIEYQTNCLYDYIEIIDGFNLESRVVGRYCNTRPPPMQIISSTQYLVIKFVSDSSVQGGGFSATVINEVDECRNGNHSCAHECVNTMGSYRCACRTGYVLLPNGRDCGIACDSTLINPTGTFNSPSYPNLYPLNTTCTWMIIPRPHHSVNLGYSHFDIEGPNRTGDAQVCLNDRLEISMTRTKNPFQTPSTFCSGGSSQPDYFLTSNYYCGNIPPPRITYRTDKLKVLFSSDGSTQKSGFSANYFTTLDGCSINNGNCQYRCVNVSGVTACICPTNLTIQSNGRDCFNGDCNYEIGTASGIISSPNYPNQYANNKNCQWKWMTTPGHRVNVSFTSFQLEGVAPTCSYDSVTFYDDFSPINSTVGKFCGVTLPSPIISTSNQLSMTFTTDRSNVFQGFQATYSSICGGTLQANSTAQYIYSHTNFGYSDYENGVLCEWEIRAPPGQFVTLAFLEFELENCGNCGCDYVEIETTSTLFRRFCSTNKPPRMCSSTLLVRFRTDGSISRKGFSLVYKATSERLNNA